MKLLLDSNVLLWWGSDNTRIGPALRERMFGATTTPLFSIVSVWKLAIKARSRGEDLDPVEVERRASRAGMQRVDIKMEHIAAQTALPVHHRDRFDHLLIAQAIVEGAAVATADRMFARYGVEVIAS